MIRQMEAGDLARCGVIYASAFPAEHWGIDWTPETATAYLEDYFGQKRFVGYVYEESGEVVGCILALRRISGSREELHICEMAVAPECQGCGVGTQLLGAVKKYSRDHGLAGMVLYTSVHAPAAAFYARHGFQVSEGTICMFCQ